MVLKIAPKHSTSPSRRSHIQEQDDSEADYETALNATGYGKFSRKALWACIMAFFTTGIENCVMSYVLPAAQCDLSLSTKETAFVQMAFMCGGVASAFFWGIVSDVVGRRNALSLTLLVNGIVTIAQSFVSDYKLLIAARCLNGFLIGGPSTLVFPYLSDLVGEKKRQMYLNIIGASFVSAWLIIPGIAWLLIPIKSEIDTIMPIHSWRLFLMLLGTPGLLSGFWVLWLPESPRLLADTNRVDEALKVLTQIHQSNVNGKYEYKIKKLISDDICFTKSMQEQNSIKQLFKGVLKDLKLLLSKPFLAVSMYLLFNFFANMAAGFGLNLWIPHFISTMNKGCGVAPSRFMVNTSKVEILDVANCNADIGADTYKANLIVGACCVLGNALCAAVCALGGTKGIHRAAIGCTLACTVACGCLAMCVCSCAKYQVAVFAAAVLNSASLNGNVLLMRLLLIALPPKLGTLGVCWGAWWGRAGGVASNYAVGALIEYSCPAPFSSVAAVLLVSVVTILLIKPYKSPPIEDLKIEDKTSSYDRMKEKNESFLIESDRYYSTHM